MTRQLRNYAEEVPESYGHLEDCAPPRERANHVRKAGVRGVEV